MSKELNLPEWMNRNNGFDEKLEKTLKLPDWMMKVSGESFKKDVSTKLNEDENLLENIRKRSSENTQAISKSPGKKQLRNDTIESKLESHKIAFQSDTILESLNLVESDFKVISLDLGWPSVISSVISKSSSLHICYGVNACSLFSIQNLKSLPKVFVSLLNHSKIRLVGNNIVSDLLKIGLDFNLDVKDLLETKLVKSNWDKSTLSCPHNWNLKENSLKFAHLPPPSLKDTFEFSGEIKYISNFSSCAHISEELIAIAEKKTSKFVIGFDLEWPFFRGHSSRVTLMQLCINSNECFLFHFLYFKSLPKTLVLLLNHNNVILTGLNIKNDIRKLSKDFRVDLTSVLNNNLIELNTFANNTLNCSERWSLARLVLHLTNKNLCKEVRMSNWSGTLTKEQKIYAATDAYASLLCYQILEENHDACRIPQAWDHRLHQRA